MERILGIVEEEDYGLETEEMLYGIINEENIQRVEEYLLGKLEEKRKATSDFSYQYKKEDTLELLIELYGKLGKPEEKLRLARYELVDKEDYARLANVLMEENRFEDAFDAVKKGLALHGEKSSRLNELYFELGGRLTREKPELVDFKTSLDVALDMLELKFDKEEYEVMKKVFRSLDKLDEFKSAMQRSLKNRNSVVSALLHDGDLKKAVDLILSEPGISSGLIVEVSKAAKDKGMIEESSMLTRIVLERGWADDRPPMKELLKVMIKALDTETLRNLCDRILKKGSANTAILLIPYLIKKSPELTGMLAKNFINAMSVELVVKVAGVLAGKAPDEGVLLCKMRINEDILRSHVYYDKAVFLLKAIMDIYAAKGNETEWVEFIRRFAAENKGKRKLIERLRKEFGYAI